jgi:hypothetical protein
MLSIYRCLLYLYPAVHRQQFGDEMTAVFGEVQAEMANQGPFARAFLYLREAAGLLAGALQQHVRTLVGDRVWLPFPTRRFTMRTEFRFPKATAVLMTIILVGIVVAIEKAKAIQASLPAVNPQLGPIQPAHFTFLPTVALMLAFFYMAGMIGWAVLFAMHRSGVHRLDDVSAEQK